MPYAALEVLMEEVVSEWGSDTPKRHSEMISRMIDKHTMSEADKKTKILVLGCEKGRILHDIKSSLRARR